MAIHIGTIFMHNEFTAVIERDEDWYIAYCPEIPGANGQGKTKEYCLQNLAEAISLILEDRREEGLRGVPHLPSRLFTQVELLEACRARRYSSHE
jgi:predicted RNase H-like HicB family nuclease